MRILVLITSTFMMLSGCSALKEIQYQAYAVGIGIDYIDNEYHVVLQFLDFTNVAKTEQGKSSQSSPVWIGTGTGKTVEDAIIKIYHGIQIPVNYDQLSLFVFGKTLLENRLDKTLRALDTNFNIRLTGMTYGTMESLEKIFTTKVPFHYAYSNSRINQPEYMQQQDSTTPSISMQELIQQYNEKTKTILLPNITINDGIMKENLKKIPVTNFNGAYIMKGKKLKGLLTESDLTGFIRVNNKSIRSSLTLSQGKKGQEQLVQIELWKPKLKRNVTKKQNDVQIGLNLKVSATIRETNYEILSPKIKKQLKEKIRNEVFQSYIKSREIGGDIYQIEDYMYRFMHKDWKKYNNQQNFPTLKKEDIHVKIVPLKSINKINPGVGWFLK